MPKTPRSPATLQATADADAEVFVPTAAGLTPDGKTLPAGQPHPVTARTREWYRRCQHRGDGKLMTVAQLKSDTAPAKE